MVLKRLLLTASTIVPLTLWIVAPAKAVVPEIKVDAATGIATSHPDLAIALAEIETSNGTIVLAQKNWQRAPWHRSRS